jgi:hypothetical protein
MSFKTPNNSLPNNKGTGKSGHIQSNSYPVYSGEFENIEDLDEVHLAELPEDEKSGRMLKYMKGFKITKDLDPFERLLR